MDTGKTLVAEPGGAYETAAAPGRAAGLKDIPGDGRWLLPDAPPRKTAKAGDK